MRRIFTLIAVSYTHLVVYKRQVQRSDVLNCIGRAGSGEYGNLIFRPNRHTKKQANQSENAAHSDESSVKNYSPTTKMTLDDLITATA